MSPRDERGVSLMELLVGCTVLGVILAASVPNLRSFRESQRISSASQTVAAAARSAQARARSENHNFLVEYRTATNSIAVVDDENNNGAADGGETVTLHAMPSGLTLQSTTFANDRLIFDSHGHATSGGTVVLVGRVGTTGKTVRVSSGTGQVKIQASTTINTGH
jgi:Tfp pilus assembly protein FimT